MEKKYEVLDGMWKGCVGYVIAIGRDPETPRIMLNIMHENQKDEMFTGWFEMDEIKEVV